MSKSELTFEVTINGTSAAVCVTRGLKSWVAESEQFPTLSTQMEGPVEALGAFVEIAADLYPS